MRSPLRVLPALLLVSAMLAPSEARAHLGLRRSEPDSNARLAAPPAAITLWFTAQPELAFSRIRLFGPAGEVALPAPRPDSGHALRAAVPASLPAGEYVVQWQTASADGHPIRGDFRFAVENAAGSAVPAVDTQAMHAHQPSRATHVDHPLYRGVRWIEFVALITVIGALGFRHLVLPAAASRGVPTSEAGDRARRMGQSLVLLYLPASLIRLYAETSAMHPGALEWATLGTMLRSPWGIGWSLGMAGAVLVLSGWRMARSRWRGSAVVAVLGGILLAVSPALTGHAAAGASRALSVSMDAAHVITSSLWIGGLLMMLLAGLPVLVRAADGSGHASVASMVHSFHPVALLCAPLVLLTGVSNAWQRIGNPIRALESPYGRVLAVKVALFAIVALLGFYHSARVRRQLGAPHVTRSFRRTAWVEVGVAAAILAVTTVLIVTPLPAPTP